MKLFSMSFFVSPGDRDISLKSILQIAQRFRQGVNPSLPNSKDHDGDDDDDFELSLGVIAAFFDYLSKSKVKPMGIVSGWRRYIIRGMFASEQKYKIAEQQRSETFTGF